MARCISMSRGDLYFLGLESLWTSTSEAMFFSKSSESAMSKSPDHSPASKAYPINLPGTAVAKLIKKLFVHLGDGSVRYCCSKRFDWTIARNTESLFDLGSCPLVKTIPVCLASTNGIPLRRSTTPV